MKRCLLIFTATYPAGDKDGFVADELPYIAPRFERVIILPVNAVGSLLPIKVTLPENCDWFVGNARRGLNGRMRDLIHGLGSVLSRDPDLRHERQTAPQTFKQRLFLDYFEGRARQASADVWPHLEKELAGYDEVVLYSYWLYTACRVMLKVEDRIHSHFPGIKTTTFSRAHRYDLYEWAEPRAYIPYRELFLDRVDGIFPCSADGVHHIQTAYPRITRRKAVVALGRLGTAEPADLVSRLAPAAAAELAEWRKADEEAAISAQSTSTHSDPSPHEKPIFEIISCSWLRPVKRVGLLVEALAGLKDLPGLPRLRWTHFGDGDSPAQLEELKALAASKLGFMDVRLTGSRSKSFIISYYRTMEPDLFINCSANEGVPVSIMEAMSCGLPVFATDVGGTREAIGEGDIGVLWPKEVTASQMTADIASFIGKPSSRREQYSKNARLRWETMCRAAVNYRQFADVLDGSEPPRDIPFVREEV